MAQLPTPVTTPANNWGITLNDFLTVAHDNTPEKGGMIKPESIMGDENATEYNIYVATNGSDTNDGLSQANAFATPKKAVDYANSLILPGYVVIINIAPGQYTCDETISVSMDKSFIANRLIIRGTGASPVSISNTYTVGTSPNYSSPIQSISYSNANHVQLNFTNTANNGGYGYHGILVMSGMTAEISNMEIVGTPQTVDGDSWGASANDNAALYIDNCVVTGFDYGYLSRFSSFVRTSESIAVDNNKDGFISHHSSSMVIYNCSGEANGGAGIVASGSSHIWFAGGVVMSNGNHGIYSLNGGSIRLLSGEEGRKLFIVKNGGNDGVGIYVGRSSTVNIVVRPIDDINSLDGAVEILSHNYAGLIAEDASSMVAEGFAGGTAKSVIAKNNRVGAIVVNNSMLRMYNANIESSEIAISTERNSTTHIDTSEIASSSSAALQAISNSVILYTNTTTNGDILPAAGNNDNTNPGGNMGSYIIAV